MRLWCVSTHTQSLVSLVLYALIWWYCWTHNPEFGASVDWNDEESKEAGLRSALMAVDVIVTELRGGRELPAFPSCLLPGFIIYKAWRCVNNLLSMPILLCLQVFGRRRMCFVEVSWERVVWPWRRTLSCRGQSGNVLLDRGGSGTGSSWWV